MLHISYLLISETPLTDVQSMITRGGILVGIVLVLEVLLLFGFSLCFFTDFGFFFRRKIFFKRDLLLVLGYLVLIGGTIYASIRSLLHDWFVFLISMKSTYLLLVYYI